jgi:nucleoside-diphosphate-sugar epimerase
MDILITGGNGYIAKSLSKGLWEGASRNNITSVTRKDFDLTNRDATDNWFFGKHFDVVIHTAVVGGSRLKKDNGDTFYQNIQMFYNLLNNKHCFGKFLHFGSGAELNMPDNPYGLSKNVISRIMNTRFDFYNIRIYNVFDENELDTRFIKSNIKRYINREPIEVHQDKLMDFFYMGDLIRLVKYFIHENNLPKNIDCSYGMNNSLLDIAHIINNLSDYKVEINIRKEKGKDYIGEKNPLNIKWKGLEYGIDKTYDKLLEENYYTNKIEISSC